MKTLKHDGLVWPPLPDHVDSSTGPVPVIRENLQPEAGPNERLVGMYVPSRRVIRIDQNVDGSVAWATLFHEEVHLWIDDTGESFSLKVEEHICRTVAAARVAAMAQTLPRRRRRRGK